MCGAVCECLKCPGKVICCCCSCALNMLCGIIGSIIVLAVIIGLIVYFTVYYHKDNGTPEETSRMAKQLAHQMPSTFKEYFKSLQ